MFYITISNGLLKDGHREKMGEAVWLFMWFIDKITRIDEDGTGWVLGGKPLKIEELDNLPRRTAQRYLSVLKENEYIHVTYTPYGFIVKVNKAKKGFGRQLHTETGAPEVAQGGAGSGAPRVKSGAPNKTVHIDNSSKTSERSSIDINPFIELFSLINPSYQILYPRKPQRAASERLLKLHDLDWWRKFMPAYQHALEDRYCPRATTPSQMEEKIGAIEHYGRSKKAEKIKGHNFII